MSRDGVQPGAQVLYHGVQWTVEGRADYLVPAWQLVRWLGDIPMRIKVRDAELSAL